MKKRVCVDISIIESLTEFMAAQGIQLDLTTDADADVSVLSCDDRKASSLKIIYSGGWIACETARALAPKLGVSMSQMGKMLTFLDVKIQKCSLGCFK